MRVGKPRALAETKDAEVLMLRVSPQFVPREEEGAISSIVYANLAGKISNRNRCDVMITLRPQFPQMRA